VGLKGGLLIVVVVAIGIAATAASAHPGHRTGSQFVASYDVVLEGGLDHTHHKDQGGGVVSDTHDNYQGRGILSLREESNGALVPSTNSFAYQSATWDLSGVNGSNGGFSCSPPVTWKDGTVDAHGWVRGGVMYVHFNLVNTSEHNDKYDCGAHFSGFASDSSYEAQSLLDLESAQPGGLFVTDSDHPHVGTVTTTLDKGSDEHSDISWTITITKRSGSKKDDGPPNPRPVCTINGTAQADNLSGTGGDDIVCAYGGNDRIDPRGGHDLVLAGPGNDVISARDHALDRIDGGAGKDSGKFDAQPRDRLTSVERPAFG
jgi:hypothetical protein